MALLRRKVGPEHLERIELFERQVDRLTRRVNQLLDASQRHGGRISLHNREGGGTVTTVVLPLGG